MGPLRQNPIQRTVSLFICVCIALCTIVAHNIAQNRPDSFPPYPPDNHHCSDDVYLREGGTFCMALYTTEYDSSTRCSGMAHVNDRSHSFTCHTHMHPQTEWAILPLHHIKEHHHTFAGTHFPSRWGYAEGKRLSWPGWLVTHKVILPLWRSSPYQY